MCSQKIRREVLDACLRLGGRLVTPKVTENSVQLFYGRQAVILQLKQQEKGRQFLRLAVALVTSIGAKKTAIVLAEVLEGQDDLQSCAAVLPHVEELLPATEFRAKAQFSSSVFEWQAVTGSHQHQEPQRSPRSGLASNFWADICPDENSLVLLIKALCKVTEEGGQIEIFTTSCWPWVMALLEWLLGPPLNVTVGMKRFRSRVSVIQSERASDAMTSLRVVYVL